MMHAWTAAVEAARLDELPDVTKRLSQALGTGEITEAEYETIQGRIDERRARPAPQAGTVKLRKGVGSRPRTDASMERRRRWAASGRLPPQLACKFTLAEQAVLAVVAVETIKRGDCRFFHEQIAALAGVSRSTVRATLRRARDLGVVTIEERRSSAWRNLASVVRIICPTWNAWNRLVRGSGLRGGGDILAATTCTSLSPYGERAGPTSPLNGFARGGGQGRQRQDGQEGPQRDRGRRRNAGR